MPLAVPVSILIQQQACSNSLSIFFLKSPRSRGLFFVFIVVFLYNLMRIKV